MSRWEVPAALGQLKGHFIEQVLDADKFKAFYMREKPNSRMMSTLFIFHPEGITICGDLSPALHGNCSALGYGLNWFAGRLSESYLCEKFLERGWHADLAESELAQMSEEARRGEHDQDTWMGIDDIRNDREALVQDLLEYRKYLRDAKVKASTGPGEILQIKAEIRGMRPKLAEARKKLVAKREEVADKLHDLANSMPSQDGLYDEWLENFESDSEGLPGYGYAPRERVWLCALQQKFSELYHKKTGTTPD